MHRCYIPADIWSETRIVPPAAEQHHLRHVLRLSPGTKVIAFDGKGREAEALLETAPDNGLQLRMLEANVTNTTPSRTIILATAVIKGSRMDSLIEKATELGVSRIEPILTAHTVVQLSPRDADRKRDRWMRVAVSAAKQCGTATLPDIACPTPFSDWLAQQATNPVPLLLAALAPDAVPLACTAQALLEANCPAIRFAVGPEGDFSAEEYAAARDQGTRFVSLGPFVLRAETAAIYGASVLQALSAAASHNTTSA